MAEDQKEVSLSELLEKIANVDPLQDTATKRVEPLFKDEADYKAFKERHDKAKIARGSLPACRVPIVSWN